jgi:hypothetical protein
LRLHDLMLCLGIEPQARTQAGARTRVVATMPIGQTHSAAAGAATTRVFLCLEDVLSGDIGRSSTPPSTTDGLKSSMISGIELPDRLCWPLMRASAALATHLCPPGRREGCHGGWRRARRRAAGAALALGRVRSTPLCCYPQGRSSSHTSLHILVLGPVCGSAGIQTVTLGRWRAVPSPRQCEPAAADVISLVFGSQYKQNQHNADTTTKLNCATAACRLLGKRIKLRLPRHMLGSALSSSWSLFTA